MDRVFLAGGDLPGGDIFSPAALSVAGGRPTREYPKYTNQS